MFSLSRYKSRSLVVGSIAASELAPRIFGIRFALLEDEVRRITFGPNGEEITR
jgi:hypothetical protein